MADDTTKTPLEQMMDLVETGEENSEREVLIPRALTMRILNEYHTMKDDLQTNQAWLMQSEKMALLGQLMAGITHEISTPVSSITSNIDLLTRALAKLKTALDSDDALESAKQRRQMLRMLNTLETLNQSNQTACDRLLQIVRSLRNFARADMIEMREGNIHEMLENALILVHHDLKRRVEVIRDYGDLPQCHCFPHQLNSVFVNLLVNASQAIKGEGTITIRTSATEEHIRIEFTDTGEGIPPENVAKIFERGFTTKPPDEGTGIGLAICQEFIQAHHGSLDVESDVGKGTTFTVTLPTGPSTSGNASQKT